MRVRVRQLTRSSPGVLLLLRVRAVLPPVPRQRWQSGACEASKRYCGTVV